MNKFASVKDSDMTMTTTRNTRLVLTALLAAILYAGMAGNAAAREKIGLYTVNDGLSQQSVTSIVQDHRDMLWVGTFDGLNRFDGKDFITFRHIPNDTTSIINNRIISLAYNETDGLWILYSSNHVGHYLSKGKFENFRLTEKTDDWGNSIKSMILCDHHLIITGPEKGPVIFNPGKAAPSARIRALKAFMEKASKKGEQIISVDFREGHLWISTSKGIYHQGDDLKVDRIKNSKGYSLKILDSGEIALWKGSTLIACNPVYNKENTDNLHETARYELDCNIQTTASSMDNEIWIGTNKGLFKTEGDNFKVCVPKQPYRAIYNDNLGMTWCGGINGLTSINPYSQPVDNFNPSEEDFALENHVNCVRVSPDGKSVWTSTKSNGIYRLGFQKNADGENEMVSQEHFLKESNITMLYPVSTDSLLYIGKNSLFLMVCHGKNCRTEELSHKTFTGSQPVRAIRIRDDIWIANEHQLYKVSLKDRKAVIDPVEEINRNLPASGIIFSLAEAPADSTIWVGYRGNGAYRIDLRDNSVRSLEEMSGIRLTSNYIWDIYFDSKGRMCLGTDAGLNIIGRDASDPDKMIYKTLTTADGLRNDKIESIEEDKENNLWLATSQGIICYNSEKGEIQTYDNEDGFRSNNFTSCSDKMEDGTLFFGSSNGLSYFNPLFFKKHMLVPSLNISSITSGNETIEREKWNHIVLKENEITLKLNAYYPVNPNKVRFRYSVNGNAWNEFSGNEIILSDLSPNKYEIAINCFNENNISSPTRKIYFRVRRHPLFSIAAQLFYLVLLCTVATLIIRNAMSRKVLDSRLKMEEELREKENRMNTEKLNFYTNMAHEIKTPLSLILGRVYDIEHSGEATPYIVRKAKLIGDNAQIIKELTEQILEFKRAISGKLDLEIQEQDIMPCIKSIINNYKDYAEKKGIRLTLESSSESIVKYIDQKKVVRIIYNLLSNAIKFSERDDEINVKVTGKSGSLVLTVSDTGQGIDSKDLPHIFERFYKSGKAGGSGIGLAFTKSLVELMNGTITVNSTYGTGTVFQVSIPDAAKTETAGMEKPETETVPEVQETVVDYSTTPDILLVEDNVDLNEYITEILSTRFKVHQCYDGKEALDVVKKEKIDLILTDVMMNGINGIELAQKIKSSKNVAHIPVVFLSAKSDPDDMLEGFKTGAVDYITKPFNPHILLIKIQNILSQYYLSRSAFMEGSTEVKEKVNVQNRDEIFIKKARDIIYKNMAEETFGVNALSQEMGISRVHLTREFQRITEKSPSSFIKTIRLNHARHLLSTGDYSIKEVLWEIGIRSHSGFTKAFKEEFGYLPSQAGNNAQNNINHDKDEK